ncbi:MAG: Fe-S cluster assembly protein SufD [Gemmatimonadota bacterium]
MAEAVGVLEDRDVAVAETRGLEALDVSEVEAAASGQPDWLREARLAAWETYLATPMPTTKQEEWRYTKVSQLGLDEVTFGAGDEGAAVRIGFEEEYAAKGVILTDLATAAREQPELVREYLGRAVSADAGKFQALNGALWGAGVFLYVPRGVRLEHPVRVRRSIERGGVALLPRTLIVAEEGSQVAYVDEFASSDLDEPALSIGAVEVFAKQAAQVQYVGLQRWGRGVRHLSQLRTIAERDANLDTLVVNLGASVARVDMAASLEGPGARSDMLGLYFAHDDQHFDHNTRQDHVSDHATSDLLYKGALYDATRSIFRGIIKVFPGAQRTDAYQTNRNLLLSGKARADSLPNLEIEADDVRCSHGATVGQLDAEEMFYLRSRGLSKEEAERLVIFGFFGEVLERLPLPGVVEELREAISRKIGWHHG